MNHQHQLKNAMLMMALAAAYPMQSFAAAGIAQFSAGDVTLRRGAATDTLTKGKNIESGDAIVTGPNGRAQVKFSDGGLVSLQPNSQFNIANYADRNDPKQDAFLVDLLRGGMRAVTGLIGKRNRENFKVTTTTATIGIRGSAFNLAYNPDGSLSVSTELDEIEVCTRAGCIGLTAGESALVVSPQEAPVRTSTRATLPTPEPRQDPEVVANQPGILPSAPINPRVLSGLAFASSSLKTGPVVEGPPPDEQSTAYVVPIYDGEYVFDKAYYDQRNYPEGTLYIDADGKPQVYMTPDVTGERTSTATTTVVSETGTMAGGDFMMLGTWTENTWRAGSDVVDVKSTAFVTGLATPTTALAALSGQRGDYAFVAGTPVMSSEGMTGELLSNSKLTVDFLGAGNYIDVNLNVRMAGGPSPVNMEIPSDVDSTDYNLRGSGTASGANFGGQLSVSSEACVSGTMCGTGMFNGFLGGNNAEKAGVTFAADTYYHGYITGGGVFARGPLTSTPMNQVVSTGWRGAFTEGGYMLDDSYYGPSYLGDNYDGTAEFTFNGDQLVKYKGISYNEQQLERTGGPGTFGAIGKITESDFIGWGSWVTANHTTTSYGYGGYTSNSAMLDSLHYIVGKPTPQNQMPQYGYANYSMVGGTAPTATYNGVSQLGQLLGASAGVDFTNHSIDLRVQAQFGTTPVTIVGDASMYNGSGGNNSHFRSGTCSSVMINGFFVGNMAYRMGATYAKDVGGLGRVNGAVVLQRTSPISISYSN